MPRALVVDDSAEHRELESVMLSLAGYDVRAAADRDETLLALAEERPSVILMDVGMPGIDGITLAREIRRDPRNDGVAIVLYSAYAGAYDPERARAAGCDAYLGKPARLDELVATVRTCIERRAG